MELVSNRHLSSISSMKCRYVGSKYRHFMTANREPLGMVDHGPGSLPWVIEIEGGADRW
jgi:hypothetical protein